VKNIEVMVTNHRKKLEKAQELACRKKKGDYLTPDEDAHV